MKKIMMFFIIMLVLVSMCGCKAKKKEKAIEYVVKLEEVDVKEENVAGVNVDINEKEKADELDVIYDEIAEHLTFFSIECSEGYDDFVKKYGAYFTDEGLSQVSSQFNVYYNPEQYKITEEEKAQRDEEGYYPVYTDGESNPVWVTEEEFIRLKKPSSTDKIKTELSDIVDNVVKYTVTLNDSVYREVTLWLDDDNLIMKFDDAKKDVRE